MMREYCKVSPKLNRSRKFKKLDNDMHRYLYVMLLISPHSNSAGCFSLPPEYGAADLGWTPEQFTNSLQALIEVGLVEYDWDEEVILITNWFTTPNAPMNTKHVLGILNRLVENPSKTLRAKAAEALMIQYRKQPWNVSKSVSDTISRAFDMVCIPSNTVSKEYRLTETETETETKTGDEDGEPLDEDQDKDNSEIETTASDPKPPAVEIVEAPSKPDFPEMPAHLVRAAPDPDLPNGGQSGQADPETNPLLEALETTERLSKLGRLGKG